MKKTKLLIGLLSAALTVGGLFSCGGNGEDNTETTSQQQSLTLTKIEVKTQPSKTKYEVDDAVDLTGMSVIATFSDGSTKDVTSECKCNLDKVSKDTTQLKISYEYGGKTKSSYIMVEIENPVKIEENTNIVYPRTIIKESNADLLFVTYYDSDTMQCDGVLELNYESSSETSKGTFTYTEQATSNYDENGNELEKINVVGGTFSISDDQISFKSKTVKTSAGSVKFVSAYDETATIKKDKDGNIVGLEMGKMIKGDDLFFGWGKTDPNKFHEGLATNYGLAAYEVYLERMVDHVIPDDMKFYHKKVTKLEVVHDVTKKEYFTGELFDLTGLELKASFDIGKDAMVNLNEVALSKNDALGVDDNKITVYYGGLSVELTFSVSQPAEAVLTSLELRGVENNVPVVAYKELKVKDAIEGYKLIAHYSDPSLDKEVSANETGLDADVYVGETRDISFEYTDNGVTKSVQKTLSFSYITPSQLAAKKESYFTYFTKGSNKVNATLELLDETNFAFTAMMAASKYTTLTGKYSIEGDTITFSEIVSNNVLGTSGMFASTQDETATLIKDNDQIVGFNFGSLETDNFFGYSASKDFNASLATSFLEEEDAIKYIYMAKSSSDLLTNETVSNNIYYK